MARRLCVLCGGSGPHTPGAQAHPYVTAIACPTLARLLRAGVVRYQGSEFVGTASDGTEVSFGALPTPTDRYLSANPTPDKW